MTYDNRQYWSKLHERLKGQLKAVGHPFLSENLNRLKYESEAFAAERAMLIVTDAFQKNHMHEITFLDIGAGTGFWTELLADLLLAGGYRTDVSALDVSSDALDVIRERLPHVHAINEDLTKISEDRLINTYDLVSSCYCFHHLVKTDEFINALKFAGSSVKKGGYLLVMDPVLTKPYSSFDTFDYYSYRGNGIPRHLYFMDDILLELGLRRCAIYPAVSFILNGRVEAQGPLGYFVMDQAWKVLCVFYRSEQITQFLSIFLKYLDRMLKRMNRSNSSSICLYQRVT